MSGLHDVHPGVHVKGEVLVKSEVVGDKSSDRRSDAAAERKNQVTGVGKTKVQTKPTTRRNDNGNKGTTDCNKVDNEATKPASEQSPNVVTQTTLSSSTLHLTSKPAVTLGKVVSTDNVAGGTSANLTEIVKSKLSVEKAVSPENEPGLLLNKILRSTAGISADLVNAVPVTTIAKTSFVPTTTTSSITVSTFPRPLLVRSRSSENLMNLAKPFGEQGHAETTTSTTSSSVSTDSFSAPSDTSATSLGFSGFVGRLVRSSSSENLAGTQNANVGLSRSSSSGKLSDLLKNSDIYATIGKAPSLDTAQTNKRVSPQLGDSPPSPSRLELMGDLGGLSFFGLGTSSTPASEAATTTMPSTATSTSKSILSGLSGLGGFFRPRSKSLDNLGPLPNNFNSQKLNGNQSNGRTSLVQRSLKRFHQAFGPD